MILGNFLILDHFWFWAIFDFGPFLILGNFWYRVTCDFGPFLILVHFWFWIIFYFGSFWILSHFLFWAIFDFGSLTSTDSLQSCTDSLLTTLLLEILKAICRMGFWGWGGHYHRDFEAEEGITRRRKKPH